ncbi:methyl-accepting chemotaxis protein [Desulfatirhabdium butyrativorans]|uniref:methyl-accepting chemotaxis protein n=1 Tax=Desulfatirhabdium butyrativorans TaxID=340467 RepID=UPI00041A8289|nr:methyl-accepting chemotaxis protein [Desulfatirhabdium butyrativorans]
MSKTMKLATRLTLFSVVMAIIILALGATGFYSAFTSNQSISGLSADTIPSLRSTMDLEAKIQDIRGTLRTLGIPGLPSQDRNRQFENWQKGLKAYEEALARYSALPKVAEEEALWKGLQNASKAFLQSATAYVQINHDIDQYGISDPNEFIAQIERFEKEHFQLVQQVFHLVYFKQNFTGGDDVTTCPLNQFIEEFKSTNPDITSALKAMREPHRRFHEAIKKVQNTMKKENISDADVMYAQVVYEQEMAQAMKFVFSNLDIIARFAYEVRNKFEDGQKLLFGPLMSTQRQMSDRIDQIVRFNLQEGEASTQRAVSRGALVKTISIASALIGVLVAIVLGWFMTRSIVKPVARIVKGISNGADEVASAASQVASASQSLAQGSSEQAASIEETSASLEEMSAMTHQNANNASEANALMSATSRVVAQANQAMQELIGSMNEISRASEDTSKIIKTIDEIAFQTNLLALNAAVEAARAGEAGAGFAVVADEVRNLAMRAAEAAKTTSALIEGTVKKVKTGSEIVSRTNAAFVEVASSTGKASELVGEIASASQEQAQGISQVNVAVTEMDKVTQQTAATAEESASASEELTAQAEQMKAMVEELALMVRGNIQHKDKSEKADRESLQQPSLTTKALARQQPDTRETRRLSTKTEVKPDELIPFEEDELKNF